MNRLFAFVIGIVAAVAAYLVGAGSALMFRDPEPVVRQEMEIPGVDGREPPVTVYSSPATTVVVAEPPEPCHNPFIDGAC